MQNEEGILTNEEFLKYLKEELSACQESINWVKLGGFTNREAWEICDRPFWLMYWINSIDFLECSNKNINYLRLDRYIDKMWLKTSAQSNGRGWHNLEVCDKIREHFSMPTPGHVSRLIKEFPEDKIG